MPTVMTLHTLADVCELVEKHLPAECRGVRPGATLPIGCTMRLAAGRYQRGGDCLTPSPAARAGAVPAEVTGAHYVEWPFLGGGKASDNRQGPPCFFKTPSRRQIAPYDRRKCRT